MADQFNPTLEYVDFPDLAKGMSTEASARSLVPGNESAALFRDVLNLSRNNGTLGSWFGIYPLAEFHTTLNYPTIDQNGSYFYSNPNGLLNGQTVMYQFYDFPQSWNNSTSTSQSTFGKFMAVIVTSREIFIYSPQNHVWYNATPVYATPAITVSANGGTGVVTTTAAADANWSQYKICPGQLIQFGGAGSWYSIISVDSDTQLTTSYSGANIGPVAYTIRRCFGGRNYSHGDNLLYGTVFNGDLYIAGRTLAGAGAGPAVIRVNNLYDNVYTTEYLLAGFDLTGSMSTNGSVIANLWDIKGLQILPDGRVVIATAEVPAPSMTGIVGNRLRYSSNTANTTGSVSAQEQWVASPAGFIDVVDLAGEITALGKLGPSTLTIHFHRGISLGTYTAQYDPPIAIQSSAARCGAISPRSLAIFDGREIFLGADGIVYRFDGNGTDAICDETVDLTHNNSENAQSSFAIANTHASIDLRRKYYRLFFCDNNFEDVDSVPPDKSDYEISTTCWLVSLDDGAIFKESYEAHITSGTALAVGAEDATFVSLRPASIGGDFGTIVVGIGSISPNANEIVAGAMMYGLSASLVDPDCKTNLLAVTSRSWLSAYYNVNPIVLSFDTDDLDFGHPGVDKTLDHVLVWLSGPAQDSASLTAAPITVSLSTDGGATFPYTKTSTLKGGNSRLYGIDQPYLFSFQPVAAEKWRIRVSRSSFNPLTSSYGIKIHRMRVYYQTQGEIEAANPDL